jgi:hypothetical protein
VFLIVRNLPLHLNNTIRLQQCYSTHNHSLCYVRCVFTAWNFFLKREYQICCSGNMSTHNRALLLPHCCGRLSHALASFPAYSRPICWPHNRALKLLSRTNRRGLLMKRRFYLMTFLLELEDVNSRKVGMFIEIIELNIHVSKHWNIKMCYSHNSTERISTIKITFRCTEQVLTRDFEFFIVINSCTLWHS